MKINSEFKDKNILVTGASSGIGECISRYFLNSGARVFMACQDVEYVKKMCLEGKYNNAIILGVDLVQDIQIYDMVKTLLERNKDNDGNDGKFDVVINCAGVKLDGDIEKTFPQEFDFSLDLNLRVAFQIIQYIIKDQLHPTPNCSIINIGCLYGTRPCYGMISHAMSKAGLDTLTRYAAAELAPKGIRVNSISACPVLTNALSLVNVPDVEVQSFNKRMEKNIPLGRIAYPDDIVKGIVFLASSRSSKITGQIIKIDGGRSLTSSGYIHYKGCRNMNSRFEPDGYKMNEYFNEFLNSWDLTKKNQLPTTGDVMEISAFVESKLKQSNFYTKDMDGHQNPAYKRVNEPRLTTDLYQSKRK